RERLHRLLALKEEGVLRRGRGRGDQSRVQRGILACQFGGGAVPARKVDVSGELRAGQAWLKGGDATQEDLERRVVARVMQCGICQQCEALQARGALRGDWDQVGHPPGLVAEVA